MPFRPRNGGPERRLDDIEGWVVAHDQIFEERWKIQWSTNRDVELRLRDITATVQESKVRLFFVSAIGACLGGALVGIFVTLMLRHL